MHLNLNLCLFLCCLLFIFCFVNASEDEVRSLLEFKKGIQSDPLGFVSNTWTRSSVESNGCPKSWHGIVCDETGNSTTAIVLDGLALVGDLKFSTLTGLKMLKNLSLSGNSFTGRLVPAIGSMSTLQHLDLSRNHFYGPIPARINDLWGLQYLDLSSNNFTGGFPSGINNLQQLKVLDLHLNGLWADVGDLFSELRNVERVDLSYNMFYGGLSSDSAKISTLTNTVRYVNLSHNRLNGEFFSADSIQLFKNLQVLDLGDNQIFGELPSFGSLPTLRILRVGNNQLQGPIPEEFFATLIPLEELDLSRNGFSGSIYNINSTTLKSLNLSSNVISGSLPSTLGSCVMVDLSRNIISGDISAMQSWGNTLEVIDLSSNALSGSFPNLTSQFERLISIKISNNTLVGGLPLAIWNSPRLSSVDLSSNQLTGSIPTSFFTSMSLINLNLSGNHFTGPIPLQGSHTSELLVLPSSPPLESLDLSNNSLTGSLPSEIGNLGRLKLLNLGNNRLSGQIPSEMSKLTGLEYLDLSVNNFKGKIPDRLPSSLKVFNVSYNDLTGPIPENLRGFPLSSFRPGNNMLIFPKDMSSQNSDNGGFHERSPRHSSRSSIRIAIIVASVGAVVMIAFVLLAYYRAQFHEFPGRNGFSSETTGRDVKLGRFSRPSFFKFQKTAEQPPPTSLSFSNDHLLTSNSRSLSGQKELLTETVERSLPEGRVAGSESTKPDVQDNTPTSGWRSSPGSPLSSSPRFVESYEQPVMLNVYSPDRLAGELFFLDSSLVFTAEELSRAPAEVLGRSSHGTLYKATLDNGHMLTVKWLRVGLVKHKKEFAREAKKIGSIRHPNIVSLRAYYWGPREQERLILADYVHGDSLALHLYEGTPRRYSPLSFRQRLKVAVDVARSLCYLHDRGLPHGNLKPTNILLVGTDLTAKITDYALHRLMTPAGTAEQILNLGALGYGAPELTTAAKPLPSFKADVYAFGVILMELLTRRSAGDIISGQSGAVDLTDWVRLCAHEGRGTECFDRDLAGGEESSQKAMDELLSISLKCILPVNERPNIRTIFDDLCSVSV
ncbi:Protein kinase domain [Macleaya cordata]|uniref:Protein kinase domain n=1 Tax=Macleaya cordata TaxID=56857 RepID=A0A200QT73_MACCD|nr:Protein kinase domain [Macleaya cordata]